MNSATSAPVHDDARHPRRDRVIGIVEDAQHGDPIPCAVPVAADSGHRSTALVETGAPAAVRIGCSVRAVRYQRPLIRLTSAMSKSARVSSGDSSCRDVGVRIEAIERGTIPATGKNGVDLIVTPDSNGNRQIGRHMSSAIRCMSFGSRSPKHLSRNGDPVASCD